MDVRITIQLLLVFSLFFTKTWCRFLYWNKMTEQRADEASADVSSVPDADVWFKLRSD